MSLVEKIGRRYQEMTASEQRIYDLLNLDPKSFAIASIGQVAGQLGLSKTTLMRFASGCGFSGYSAFKRVLQEEVLLEVSPARKLQKVIQSTGTIRPSDLCREEIRNIRRTMADFSEEEGARLVRSILDAGEIFTLSWGISGHLAEIFAQRMKMIGIRCTTISRRHGTLVEEAALVQKGELVLVFEIPPYNRETSEAVKMLKEKGAHLVLVTDSPRCPLAPLAESAFYCPTGATFFGNSLVGPLSWVNLISSLLIYEKRENVLDMLENQERIFADDRHYHR